MPLHLVAGWGPVTVVRPASVFAVTSEPTATASVVSEAATAASGVATAASEAASATKVTTTASEATTATEVTTAASETTTATEVTATTSEATTSATKATSSGWGRHEWRGVLLSGKGGPLEVGIVQHRNSGAQLICRRKLQVTNSLVGLVVGPHLGKSWGELSLLSDKVLEVLPRSTLGQVVDLNSELATCVLSLLTCELNLQLLALEVSVFQSLNSLLGVVRVLKGDEGKASHHLHLGNGANLGEVSLNLFLLS